MTDMIKALIKRQKVSNKRRKKIRKIEKKNWVWKDGYDQKVNAQKKAKLLRKKGWNARVVRGNLRSYNWLVFRRRK